MHEYHISYATHVQLSEMTKTSAASNMPVRMDQVQHSHPGMRNHSAESAPTMDYPPTSHPMVSAAPESHAHSNAAMMYPHYTSMPQSKYMYLSISSLTHITPSLSLHIILYTCVECCLCCACYYCHVFVLCRNVESAQSSLLVLRKRKTF